MPGYSFFKSEGENYGNVKSIYTRDIRLYIDNLKTRDYDYAELKQMIGDKYNGILRFYVSTL